MRDIAIVLCIAFLVMFVLAVWIAPPPGRLMCWYTSTTDAHRWGDHRDCTKADYVMRNMKVPPDVQE